MTANDTYGSTLHVTQYQQLVEFARGIPRVTVRKPVEVTSRFEFIVLDAPPVVLYPWRYATDRSKSRDAAKLRKPVSDLRRTLLSIAARHVDPQLTLEQATLGAEQLEADFVDEQAVLEQLANFGRVVTVGYASNPSAGLFDIGWGDMELINEATGEVVWHHWESLAHSHQASGISAPVLAVAPLGDRGRAGRFDDAPLNDDFGLAPRTPLAEPPVSELWATQSETGTDEPT